jgi:hypothetical protein
MAYYNNLEHNRSYLIIFSIIKTAQVKLPKSKLYATVMKQDDKLPAHVHVYGLLIINYYDIIHACANKIQMVNFQLHVLTVIIIKTILQLLTTIRCVYVFDLLK